MSLTVWTSWAIWSRLMPTSSASLRSQSRARAIKPEAFASESLAAVSLSAERTFFGLLAQVDDRGRVRDQPVVVAGVLWSLRAGHGPMGVEDDLIQLAAEDLICRYTGDDGKAYLHVVTWSQDQKINRPSGVRTPRWPHHDTPRWVRVGANAFQSTGSLGLLTCREATDEDTTSMLLLAVVCVAAASVVGGVTGFATYLLVTPALLLLGFGVPEVVVVNLTATRVTCVAALSELCRHVEWRAVLLLAVGGLPGAVAGA